MNSIEYLGSHAEALFLGAGRLEYPLLGDCCNVCVVHNPENGMEGLVLPLFASTGNFILVAFLVEGEQLEEILLKFTYFRL